MAVDLKDGGRIDAATINHNREQAVRTAPGAANGRYLLTGLHTLTHLHVVLRIETINGLQTVVVADNHYITELRRMARHADVTVEHGEYNIAFGRSNLKILVINELSLTHRQGKGVFFGRKNAEINIEGIAAVEEARRRNTDDRLFDWRERLGLTISRGRQQYT